jgi:hypothetical protein
VKACLSNRQQVQTATSKYTNPLNHTGGSLLLSIASPRFYSAHVTEMLKRFSRVLQSAGSGRWFPLHFCTHYKRAAKVWRFLLLGVTSCRSAKVSQTLYLSSPHIKTTVRFARCHECRRRMLRRRSAGARQHVHKGMHPSKYWAQNSNCIRL